jgi:hypothetical protein
VSLVRRLRVDVYGRFVADVIRRHGVWTVYRLGNEGKRSKLVDVVVADDASSEEILEALETVYHEWAGPDRELRVIDILMA